MLFSPVLCRDENSAHVRFLLAQGLTSAATLVAITHFKWTPPFAFGLKTYIFLPCSQAKALGHYLKGRSSGLALASFGGCRTKKCELMDRVTEPRVSCVIGRWPADRP